MLNEPLSVCYTPTNATLHLLSFYTWFKTFFNFQMLQYNRNTACDYNRLRSNSYECVNHLCIEPILIILKLCLRSFSKIYSQEETMRVVSGNLIITDKSNACHCSFPTLLPEHWFNNLVLDTTNQPLIPLSSGELQLFKTNLCLYRPAKYFPAKSW